MMTTTTRSGRRQKHFNKSLWQFQRSSSSSSSSSSSGCRSRQRRRFLLYSACVIEIYIYTTFSLKQVCDIKRSLAFVCGDRRLCVSCVLCFFRSEERKKRDTRRTIDESFFFFFFFFFAKKERPPQQLPLICTHPML